MQVGRRSSMPIASMSGVDPQRSDLEQLRRDVATYDWFHTIDLGHGIVTRGGDESPRKLGWIKLPPDLRGKSVLDIGAWDGFFSWEAERRGAASVLAVDSVAWQEPAWGPNGYGTKRGFEIARRALNSRVEDLEIEFNRISPETVGVHDVVLLLGVLYHMKHPWLMLERAASVCRELLIVETHVDLLDFPRPAMALYPGAELADDASNWWGPNIRALRAMVREVGFRTVEVVHRERRAYRLARAAYRRVRGPHFHAQQGRCAVHGWRWVRAPGTSGRLPASASRTAWAGVCSRSSRRPWACARRRAARGRRRSAACTRAGRCVASPADPRVWAVLPGGALQAVILAEGEAAPDHDPVGAVLLAVRPADLVHARDVDEHRPL
jgi:tRNA (mo5U34)-methyltransferase